MHVRPSFSGKKIFNSRVIVRHGQYSGSAKTPLSSKKLAKPPVRRSKNPLLPTASGARSAPANFQGFFGIFGKVLLNLTGISLIQLN